MNARASYAMAHWTATAYVDNLTNVLGVNSFSDPLNYGTRYSALVSRPRTVGLTLSYSVKD